MARRAPKQPALELIGGAHAGPLFIIQKRRAPARPPGSTRMPGVLRRAAERRATPAWADRQAIAAIWRQARELTRATGVRHSVDHMVPLSHPAVCGLHTTANLCVLPLSENVRKSNSRWPDMWAEQLTLID